MTDKEVVSILGEPTSVEQMTDRPADGFMWNYFRVWRPGVRPVPPSWRFAVEFDGARRLRLIGLSEKPFSGAAKVLYRFHSSMRAAEEHPEFRQTMGCRE